MTLIRTLAALAAVLAATLIGTPSTAAAERGIVVLDASGSMWGQIGGEAKMSIARRVLANVTATLPPEMELGLIAYGHREKGRCDDIELVVEPAPGSIAAVAGAADGLRPLGKTPLSQAVKQAAEALKFTETKATVILVTDGLETCNADPCALGRELEAAGVDFTAHVVGFGLSAEEGRQVACLAEETGGLYLPAGDADQLSDALSEPLTEIAEAAPEAAPAEPAAPPPATLPEASLDAPETIEIGRTLTIGWQGPGDFRDAIELHDPDARGGEGRRVGARRLGNGDMDIQSVAMPAPVNPGMYELRYYWREGGAILATRAVEVVDAEVSLEAPATVHIAERFTVAWTGPGAIRDYVAIVAPAIDVRGDRRVDVQRVVNGDMDKRTVSLNAPAEPGFYRLHYVSGDGAKVLATREIEILEQEVALDAPAEVGMGKRFEVTWTGPGAVRDAVQIFDPAAKGGEGAVVASARIVNGDMDARSVKLNAPVAVGDYQLRYYNGDNVAILATRPLKVGEVATGLDAPETALIGHTITVAWEGPGATRDAVDLFDPAAKAGKGAVLASQRIVNGDMDARTVRLVVPATPGDYVLRYYNGDSRKVLAERPITVEPMDVSLDAPSSIAANAFFEVAWVGPGATRDAVEIYDPAAGGGRGKVLASMRLINGDYDGRKAKFRAPKQKGGFVLRYYNGDSRMVLYETPIVVE